MCRSYYPWACWITIGSECVINIYTTGYSPTTWLLPSQQSLGFKSRSTISLLCKLLYNATQIKCGTHWCESLDHVYLSAQGLFIQSDCIHCSERTWHILHDTAASVSIHTRWRLHRELYIYFTGFIPLLSFHTILTRHSDISTNLLTILDANAFGGLTALLELLAMRVRCVSRYFTLSSDLSHNPITSLPSNLLRNTTLLQSL